MRLKSFTAPTLPKAMELVREVLGENAVLLSTEQDGDGGVRVTAALEDEPLDGFAPVENPSFLALDQLKSSLDFHRVPRGLADRILGAAAVEEAEDSTLALASALDAEFLFKALPKAPGQRPLMLVGPPGAGKTASVAKLCALHRLSGGKARVVTMDGEKAGGLAQMQAFAEALDVPLTAAASVGKLVAAVSERSSDELVLIDTVGINPFSKAEQESIGNAVQAIGALPVLALAAGGDPAESAETALLFADAGAEAMIACKMDAARRIGGILAAAHVARLPLIAAGISPQIGGGLAAINPVSLARVLLAEEIDEGLGMESAGEPLTWCQ